MSERFTFKVDELSYSVDDSAYRNGEIIGTLFSVKKCPRCQKINSPLASVCYKCNGSLSDDDICIAIRVKRTVLGIWIGSGIYGVVIVVLGLILRAKIVMGAIPTVLILGGCMFVGELIAGKRIVIEQQATADYKQFKRIQALKGTLREISDPSKIKMFELTKTCSRCNALTESDSVYCSNCGKKF